MAATFTNLALEEINKMMDDILQNHLTLEALVRQEREKTMGKNDEYDLVCESCGCDKVEGLFWVRLNTHEVMDSYEGEMYDTSGYYCPECCDDNAEIISRIDYEPLEEAAEREDHDAYEDYMEDCNCDDCTAERERRERTGENLLTEEAEANTLLPGGEW